VIRLSRTVADCLALGLLNFQATTRISADFRLEFRCRNTIAVYDLRILRSHSGGEPHSIGNGYCFIVITTLFHSQSLLGIQPENRLESVVGACALRSRVSQKTDPARFSLYLRSCRTAKEHQ
jgi:hypothetical protein